MSFFESPLIYKLICSLLTMGMLGFLIFFLVRTKWLKFMFWYDLVEFFTVKIYGSKKSKRCWKRIMKKMKKITDNQSEVYNKLIIKADKIMGCMLANLVPLYQATDFTERLRVTGLKTFTYPKLLWEAHTYTETYLKNNQVILTREQTQNMLNIYQTALKDLEII